MRFTKILGWDLENGLWKNKMITLAPFFMTLVMFADFWNRICAYDRAGIFPKISVSFGDFWMYLYGGMKVYRPQDGTVFLFPVIWILLLAMPAFLTLHYPFRDMQDIGPQILCRSGSRKNWWLSKCFWNLCCTTCFYLMVLLTALFLCILWKRPLTANLHPRVIQILFQLTDQPSDASPLLPWYTFLLPLLISLALNILQMTLSLFLKPLFGFLCTSVILICSAYAMHPALLGNYGMLLRHNWYMNEGVSYGTGIALALFFIFITIIVGLIRFQSHDITNGVYEL